MSEERMESLAKKHTSVFSTPQTTNSWLSSVHRHRIGIVHRSSFVDSQDDVSFNAPGHEPNLIHEYSTLDKNSPVIPDLNSDSKMHNQLHVSDS